MKYTLTLLAIFFMKISTYAQIDTLNYIKQFEINKANYIGKPFSKLLNDMTLVKPTFLFSMLPKKSSIDFYTEENLFTTGNVSMSIYWQSVIPENESIYYEQLNQFKFTDDEKNYYSNKIIKNIIVYVYPP